MLFFIEHHGRSPAVRRPRGAERGNCAHMLIGVEEDTLERSSSCARSAVAARISPVPRAMAWMKDGGAFLEEQTLKDLRLAVAGLEERTGV